MLLIFNNSTDVDERCSSCRKLLSKTVTNIAQESARERVFIYQRLVCEGVMLETLAISKPVLKKQTTTTQ